MHKRYGFELIRNTPTEKTFRTTCACYDPDHDLTIDITYNKEDHDLAMEFFINTEYIPCRWSDSLKFHRKVWSRIKVAFNILRGKPLRYEASFIFRGRNHIEDFSDMMLLLGKDCVKESDELHECKKELRKIKER